MGTNINIKDLSKRDKKLLQRIEYLLSDRHTYTIEEICSDKANKITLRDFFRIYAKITEKGDN